MADSRFSQLDKDGRDLFQAAEFFKVLPHLSYFPVNRILIYPVISYRSPLSASSNSSQPAACSCILATLTFLQTTSSPSLLPNSALTYNANWKSPQRLSLAYKATKIGCYPCSTTSERSIFRAAVNSKSVPAHWLGRSPQTTSTVYRNISHSA